MTKPNASPEQSATRFGFVSLLGVTNSGKSTLVNRVVTKKVSIVSRKVQTTRMSVRGIVVRNNSQIVFVDTPGIFVPRRRLDRAMISAAWRGSAESDITLVLVDSARGIIPELRGILEGIVSVPTERRILVLNKIDRVKKSENLLTLASEINDIVDFGRTFMVCATSGDGCDDLVDYLADCVEESPWHYPSGDVTDLSVSLFTSEITRECLYDRLHQEIPYSVHVETEKYESKPDGSVRIDQIIFLKRPAHKKIVLGKGGEMIKSVSTASRKQISALLGCPVHLFLYAKVRENWVDDREFYDSMGLDFDSE